MNDYDKVRIEFLERQLGKVSEFVSFIKTHHHHAYMDATINGKCDVAILDEHTKNRHN
jgi:predicted nucleotidyltransferase component of viral defense system